MNEKAISGQHSAVSEVPAFPENRRLIVVTDC